MAEPARRGARGGQARDARRALVRVPVVRVGGRRVTRVRPGRARARDAHLRARPAPPRAYHGAPVDRRPARVQLPGRSGTAKALHLAGGGAAAPKPGADRGDRHRSGVAPERHAVADDDRTIARTADGADGAHARIESNLTARLDAPLDSPAVRPA